MGNGAAALVRRAIADSEIDFDQALYRMRKFYYDHVADTTVLYPGVSAGLKQLKEKNCKLAVVTNKPLRETEKILTLLGVRVCFDDVIGGDSDYALKPEPDSLLALKEKYNIPENCCWMVGDHYTDLEAARRAGFRSIFVTYGLGETREENPDYTAEQFSDINLILSGF